jgi:glycosyltransferase involved in cell wall biosynthesis
VAAFERITVLFMQTQTYFGADSQIHASMAEHLDHERFRVIVACNRDVGAGAESFERFRAIPGIWVVPTDFGRSREGTAGRLQLLLLAVRRIPTLWGLFRLGWFARRNQVDIVHGTEKPRDVIYGYVVGRIAGAKTLTELHVKVEGWMNPVGRRVMHHNDALVGVSEFVAQSAVNMGYRPERTHHVLNALEIDRWDPDRVDASPLRAEFGVADETALIAIVARVFPWKGHERLIRALARVRDQGLDFHLLVVGDDDPRATPDGGSYSARLKAIIAELDLGRHVTFTGFRRDMPGLMKAIDIFAMPTYEEPFGMVFLEAMAMRTPVVAIRSGGVVEFIEDGVTGLLSETDDEDGLARNLAALIEDPALRAQLGAAGRELVVSQYAAPRMAKDIERIYLAMLDRPAER